MATTTHIEQHVYEPNFSKLLQLNNRSELRTILICGLTSTLWARFLNAAVHILLPKVNIRFVAIDRFPADSSFVTEAHQNYGLPFKPGNWYEQFDLEKRFNEFRDATHNSRLWLGDEHVKIDGVICTTTPNFNLAIAELWLAQGVYVYLDKPLVLFNEYELRRIAQLKQQYRDLLIVGDFFIGSPVVSWALGHMNELLPGGKLLKVFGACTEPWTLDSEMNAAGNRRWMTNPAICKGVGGNDCGVHVLGSAKYIASRLGYAMQFPNSIGVPITGRYLQNGKTDLVVETGFFGQYEVDDIPVSVLAGKGLQGDPYYGLGMRFNIGQINLMVGTPRFDPHVAVDNGQSTVVHKIVGGGLGYNEIFADFLTCLYGGARTMRENQAHTFAAMHGASIAINRSYEAFEGSGATFADYPVGTRLPGIPEWAILRMPKDLAPDRNTEISF